MAERFRADPRGDHHGPGGVGHRRAWRPCAAVAATLPTSLVIRLAKTQAQTVDFATSNVRGGRLPLLHRGAPRSCRTTPSGPARRGLVQPDPVVLQRQLGHGTQRRRRGRRGPWPAAEPAWKTPSPSSAPSGSPTASDAKRGAAEAFVSTISALDAELDRHSRHRGPAPPAHRAQRSGSGVEACVGGLRGGDEKRTDVEQEVGHLVGGDQLPVQHVGQRLVDHGERFADHGIVANLGHRSSCHQRAGRRTLPGRYCSGSVRGCIVPVNTRFPPQSRTWRSPQRLARPTAVPSRPIDSPYDRHHGAGGQGRRRHRGRQRDRPGSGPAVPRRGGPSGRRGRPGQHRGGTGWRKS